MKLSMKICLWALAFVPLVVDQNVFFPYISAKVLFIQFCLIIAGVLSLVYYFSSEDFRDRVLDRSKILVKNPLVIAVVSFVFVNFISIFFAIDKYSAFWGNLERGEGFVGLVFFVIFLIFLLFIFEKKDWSFFYKLSLFTGSFLIIKEGVQFFYEGIRRPGSFNGNPEFLAGYLLFTIISSFLVWKEKGNNRFWRYFSVVVGITAVLGIFVAETRGTILGIGLGVVSILIYSIVTGGGYRYKNLSPRQISGFLLCISIIFLATLVLTRDSSVWQKIPGLSRVSEIGLSDGSSASRLYIYEAALKSVNPITAGWGKLLIGWGLENFVYANNKYYNSDLYKIEVNWFDRSHNKFLDVLVMTGLPSLLIYILIWSLLFRYILRKNNITINRVALLFWAPAFLVHIFFAFDEISTVLTFYFILAFLIFSEFFDTSSAKEKKVDQNFGNHSILLPCVLFVLSLFMLFVFFRNTVPGYIQMREYTSKIKSINSFPVEDGVSSIFSPFTTAQVHIRRNFLKIATEYFDSDKYFANRDKVLDLAVKEGEDYLTRRPVDLGFLTTMADFYNRKAGLSRDLDRLHKGEEYFRTILGFAPNRPDINRGLAVNLLYQKRNNEAFSYFERAFNLSPSYFTRDQVTIEAIYVKFVQYFYMKKDKDGLVKAVDRLTQNDYKEAALLGKVVDYVNKTGEWPRVNFR